MFRVIPAPVCVDATYRRPLIAIGARRGPPGTRFVFSVDVVGWNDFVVRCSLASPLFSTSPRLARTHRRPPNVFGLSWMFCDVAACCSSLQIVYMLPNVPRPLRRYQRHQPHLPALNASPPSRCDKSTFTFSGLNTLSPPILLPNTRHDVSTAAQWVEDVVDVAQTRGMS